MYTSWRVRVCVCVMSMKEKSMDSYYAIINLFRQIYFWLTSSDGFVQISKKYKNILT